MTGGHAGWDAAERPDGPALIDIARRTLLEAVLPSLEGDARLKALMVANALAIALRERTDNIIGPAAYAVGDAAALCRDIRAGTHDPGTAGHAGIAAALLALAEAKCRVSAPKALER